MYPFSHNALRYTVKNLFAFAGFNLDEDFELEVNHKASSLKVTLGKNKHVLLKLMHHNEVDQLFNGKLQPKHLPAFDAKVKIPLFFTENKNDFAAISDDTLIIHADIVTISFIMLSRYEETLIEERDHLNRFEYKNSLACKYDFIDIPIVDEYSMLLRIWLLKFMPSLKVHKRTGGIIPTHDIDYLFRFGNLFRNITTIIGGDIKTRKSLSIAFESVKQCIATFKDAKNDPLILAIERLIKISKENGFIAHFNFKGLRKGQNDCTYDVSVPELKYCMNKISEAGMVVGMHAGLDSQNSEAIFKQEKKNIESVYGKELKTNRQHYLLFNINKSVQIWQNCNIQNDYTLGYSEREGFRCGTCHDYFLYDLENDHTSTVKEHPLIAMDTTLFYYRRLNIENALKTIETLYKRCQAVEGDFVLLWHNDKLFRDYEKRYRGVYCKFLERNS